MTREAANDISNDVHHLVSPKALRLRTLSQDDKVGAQDDKMKAKPHPRSFSFRWVMRSLASLLRTAIEYAAGSPTTKTFFLPRVIAV